LLLLGDELPLRNLLERPRILPPLRPWQLQRHLWCHERFGVSALRRGFVQ
jgi:hypothetical protein